MRMPVLKPSRLCIPGPGATSVCQYVTRAQQRPGARPASLPPQGRQQVFTRKVAG